MSQHIHVKGIHTGIDNTTGTVPVRREFNDYVIEDPDSLNLFFLGLDRMQQFPIEDKLSWYQISGIHGRPFKPWDGAEGHSKYRGYCSHSSNLFPTWHRPYVALFEQTLHENIQEVVKEYTTPEKRERYQKVAEAWRLPYWDWAASFEVPELLSCINSDNKTVQVDHPTRGEGWTIRNPLYSYIFPDGGLEGLSMNKDDPGNYYTVWKQTIRHPADPLPEAPLMPDSETDSDPRKFVEAFRNGGPHPCSNLNIRDRIHRLLSEDNTYNVFSHDVHEKSSKYKNDEQYKNGGQDYDSLESVHNTVHGLIGGRSKRVGHMTDSDVAAFDPIFWLHHCFVDRVLALWQVLHENSWVGDQEGADKNLKTGKSPLYPFHKNDDEYWTSNEIEDCKVFGYTYPELSEPNASPQQLKATVTRAVAKLYGHTAPSARLYSAGKNMRSKHMISAIPSSIIAHFEKQKEDKFYTGWICNIRVSKYELGGSFAVDVYLGGFSDEPGNDQSQANLVGSVVVLTTNIKNTECTRCKEGYEAKLIVTGAVPLTNALLDRAAKAKVESLEAKDVVPYLKENLRWRVNKFGVESPHVPNDKVPNLMVGVTSVTVKLPENDHSLPIYQDDWTPHPGATKDIPTGKTRDNTY